METEIKYKDCFSLGVAESIVSNYFAEEGGSSEIKIERSEYLIGEINPISVEILKESKSILLKGEDKTKFNELEKKLNSVNED